MPPVAADDGHRMPLAAADLPYKFAVTVYRAQAVEARIRIGLAFRQTEKVITAVFDTIKQQLADGGEVSIVGFGVFHVSERAERQGRNPQTGETLTIPSTKKPRFRPGKPLKEAVK